MVLLLMISDIAVMAVPPVDCTARLLARAHLDRGLQQIAPRRIDPRENVSEQDRRPGTTHTRNIAGARPEPDPSPQILADRQKLRGQIGARYAREARHIERGRR